MTTTDCWSTLGLIPTADDREIRRAYARLLKTTRPEEDPEAFQALRTAFEEAMWQASELARQPVAAARPEGERDLREAEIELLLRPHIETLAELNERGTVEEAMTKLQSMMTELQLDTARERDPLLWQMFEDGMLWVCCDIAANHDDFLRTAVQMFGWIEPAHWLSERDPKTVEWLKLRLLEADALEQVDHLLNLVDAGQEPEAIATLTRLADDELLFNVDVRHLFEAELMVGLSEFETLPAGLTARAAHVFAWWRDHRHLEEYHPEAWHAFHSKSLSLRVLANL